MTPAAQPSFSPAGVRPASRTPLTHPVAPRAASCHKHKHEQGRGHGRRSPRSHPRGQPFTKPPPTHAAGSSTWKPAGRNTLGMHPAARACGRVSPLRKGGRPRANGRGRCAPLPRAACNTFFQAHAGPTAALHTGQRRCTDCTCYETSNGVSRPRCRTLPCMMQVAGHRGRLHTTVLYDELCAHQRQTMVAERASGVRACRRQGHTRMPPDR